MAALWGDPDYESNLNEMAELFMLPRMRAKDEMEGTWGAPVEMNDKDDEWDSGAVCMTIKKIWKTMYRPTPCLPVC
jgi:hypothetical protein